MSNSLSALEFLNCLAGIKVSEFAFKKYRDRDIDGNILFEVLLNEDKKLVVRMAEVDFKKLIAREEIMLARLGLFDFDMVVGNIMIRDILHDAEPFIPELIPFFEKKMNSKYRNKPEVYPLGIAGGNIKILSGSKRELRCELVDISRKMSGIYRLSIRDENLFIVREE